MQNVADHYLAERVNTASPAELTAMLFDACCAGIRGAITRLEAGLPAEATPRLLKAQDIVLELRCSLDKSAGPLATQLDALYAWSYGRLIEANLKRDVKAAHEALDVLDGLRSAWRQACLAAAA